MSQSQAAINAKATRWLADILERRGIANPHDLAEHVTTELLAQGLAPVPRPFPLRPTAPVASEEARQKARDAAAEAVAAAKAKRTRVGPPPTPSVEDLAAGAALLGLNQDDVATAIEQLNLAEPTAAGQPAVGYRCDPIGHVQVLEDEHGVYGIPIDTDPTMAVNHAELRSDDGTVLATFDGLDDVVDVVIHEADCHGGDCGCGEDDGLLRVVADAAAAESAALHDADPDAWRAEREATWPEPDEPSTWGPDDPPF